MITWKCSVYPRVCSRKSYMLNIENKISSDNNAYYRFQAEYANVLTRNHIARNSLEHCMLVGLSSVVCMAFFWVKLNSVSM